MRLNSVVLPAPFGPIRPRISPSLTTRSTVRTAMSPPNARETFFSSRSTCSVIVVRRRSPAFDEPRASPTLWLNALPPGLGQLHLGARLILRPHQHLFAAGPLVDHG